MAPNGPDSSSYARRRQALIERLDQAVLFIPARGEALYSNDVHYRYRQDSNIRYLCGFEEPAALLINNCGNEQQGFSLLVNPRDESSETWTGPRAGVEGARDIYGADHAHPLDQCDEILLLHLREAATLHYTYSGDRDQDSRVLELVEKVNSERPRKGIPALTIADARETLAEMRSIKSSDEIRCLRTAAELSVKAHRRLMETLAPGMYEYEVEAILDYGFRSAGCTGPAYPTIAAGGEGATVLHYTRNDRRLAGGDLLLVDAGAEWGGYCADITRTIPVGPSYSAAQAELYDLVLAAQEAALALARPGSSLEAMHQAALEVLCEGLCDLSILEGPANERLADSSYKRFYMHNSSHWLGMDVHDAGVYRENEAPRVLREGMAATVEPGLYISADAEGVDEKYRGIGIRIEDDIVITATGCEILSSELPKTRSEIEALRLQPRRRTAAR